MKSPVRVAIADDHALFRQGLKSLLLLEHDVAVVAEVERAADVLPMLDRHACDVLLLDLHASQDRFVLKCAWGVFLGVSSERGPFERYHLADGLLCWRAQVHLGATAYSRADCGSVLVGARRPQRRDRHSPPAVAEGERIFPVV